MYLGDLTYESMAFYGFSSTKRALVYGQKARGDIWQGIQLDQKSQTLSVSSWQQREEKHGLGIEKSVVAVYMPFFYSKTRSKETRNMTVNDFS